MLNMRTLTHSPPEVLQGQRGTLVHVLGLLALIVDFYVEKMLQLYRRREDDIEILQYSTLQYSDPV